MTSEKVAGSIPVWGSEIVFPRLVLDERSSIIQDIPNLPHVILKHREEVLYLIKTRGDTAIAECFNHVIKQVR